MGAARDDLDHLLAHAGWARALARSLVRGDDRADDLVQRAWLAALRRPPEDDVPPRRWLAAVMRNLVRDDAREAARRDRREREVARAERVDDGLDDAAEAQARLLAAVRELPEPLRAAVWSRYYEGLAPREIAARDGVPLATVKTRLARGLDALRARFDREHGGNRAAWVALLLPLAESRHAGAVTLGALLVKTKIQVALLAGAAACAVGAWWLAGPELVPAESRSANEVAAMPTDPAREEPREDAVSGPVEDASRRRASQPVADAAVAPTPAASEPVVRRGRVIDLEGLAVAGVEVRDAWDPPGAATRPRVVSGSDGRFTMTVAQGENWGHLVAQGEGWFTVFAGRESTGLGSEEIHVIVAPSARFAGVVLDATGAPVPDAEVTVELDDTVRRGLGARVAGAYEVGTDTRSDAAGRFVLESAPIGNGVIAARRGVLPSAFVPIPRESREDLVLKMGALSAAFTTLHGRVLDESGTPVPDAVVALADRTTRSVAEGVFVLDVERAHLETEFARVAPAPLLLQAVAAGAQPARMEIADFASLEALALRGGLELWLGPPALSIRGVVVDAAGEPIVGASVDLVEETPLGVVEERQTGTLHRWSQTIENVMRGNQTPPPTLTSLRGVFALGGLLDRPYRIRASSARIQASVELGPIAAGTNDVRIVLESSAPARPIAGQVVDGSGSPVAHAQVMTWVVFEGSHDEEVGPTATTDGAGRFRIDALRGRLSSIRVSLGSYGTLYRAVGADEVQTDLRLVLRRRRSIQVDAADRPGFADSVQFQDEAGNAVYVSVVRSVVTSTGSTSLWTQHKDLVIEGGRSDLGQIEEQPLTAVFQKEGNVVARVPLAFAAEGVTTVKP